MTGPNILQLDSTAGPTIRRPSVKHQALLFSLGIAVLLPIMVLLKYGAELHPQWFRFADAAAHWPNVGAASLLAVGDRALLSNVFPAWIAGALHLSGEHTYVAFSIVVTVLAISLPVLLNIREGLESFTKLYVLVCLGGALAPVLLMWVGGYDALLVCCFSVGALTRNRYISAVGWVLAAFTHSAVALPAALLWCCFCALHDKGWRTRTTWVSMVVTGTACVIGYAAIHVLTDSWGGSTDRFTLFRMIPFDGIVQCYANAFPAIIFSGLGITWILVLLPSIRRLPSTRIFFVFALVVILVIPLVAVDETRITALILFPMTLAWIDRVSADVPKPTVDRIWRWALIPALVLPVCVVWMGSSYWPYWL